MPALATAIPNTFAPITAYAFGGHYWLEIACHDYDEFRIQPSGLEYEGRVYGRTGWNSDRCVAYYSTRVKLAMGV